MTLLVVSFLAGALTVLAPCILPLLPIIIGGSVSDHERRSPLLITVSLALSIVLFTLVLKVSTIFIDIPQRAWAIISGTIIILFGIVSLFPDLWKQLSDKGGFLGKTNTILERSAARKNHLGDVLMGAALGPVFSSCSPTYFVILASVLPERFAVGLLYLAAYALGLSLVLLGIGYMGQRLVKRLQWAANPKGWFKRGLGILFILVGLFIMTGFDKQFQTYLVSKGIFDITTVELKLLEKTQEK